MLNNIREGILTDGDRQTLNGRFIDKESSEYSHEAVHTFTENSLVNNHNQKELDGLPDDKITINAINKLPPNITDSVLNKFYQRSQMDTNGSGLA